MKGTPRPIRIDVTVMDFLLRGVRAGVRIVFQRTIDKLPEPLRIRAHDALMARSNRGIDIGDNCADSVFFVFVGDGHSEAVSHDLLKLLRLPAAGRALSNNQSLRPCAAGQTRPLPATTYDVEPTT